MVHGLTRVRGMTQDDAHIFCTREQMADELALHARPSCCRVLRDFGLDDFYLELSTRPEGKAVGSDEELGGGHRGPADHGPRAMDLELVIDEGGGAFYGPKISVAGQGRHRPDPPDVHHPARLQPPERFEIEYVGADNARHRPIMIHRALFGSVERFFAILLEHYAGALPTWLSPEQVRVLGGAGRPPGATPTRWPTGCRAVGVRVAVDPADEPLGARIRRAKMLKIPYILVVGDDDVAAGTVGRQPAGERPPRPGRAAGRRSPSALEREIAERRAARGSGDARAPVAPDEPRAPVGRLAVAPT